MSFRLGITRWAVVITFASLALLSLVLAAFALTFRWTLSGTVLLAIATSFLSTIVVFVCDSAIPRAEMRIELIRGHRKIYKRYQECLKNLAKDEPHTIRTVASLPPSEDVAKKWDDFLVPFLKEHSDVSYKRVIVVNANPDWARRRKELKDR